MNYITIFVLLIFYGRVFGDEPLLKPCALEDLPCLKKSATEFLTKVAGGLGEPYNIQPLDPAEIKSFDVDGCCDKPTTTTLHFKNIKITGLKDAKLESFKINKEAKDVEFNMITNFKIESEIVIIHLDPSKTYSGTMEMKAKTATKSGYQFELKKDDKGVEHFIIGPDVNTCLILGDLEVTVSPELKEMMEKDPVVIARMEKHKDRLPERRKEIACLIVMQIFPKLIDAFRQGGKHMAVTDMLTGLN